MLGPRSGQTPRPHLRDEQGVALLIALMAMALITALATALVLTTMTETSLAGHYGQGAEALYAADAAVERVLPDVLAVPDWNAMLGGARLSSFVDGAPSGGRTLGDGSTLDVTEATNVMRCGKPSACSDSDMDAASEERPWGANNPRWQLFAFAPVADLRPSAPIGSRLYVVVWVADDPSENDGNPLVDGNPPASGGTAADNPGRGVLALLACAYGAGGVRRVVFVTIAREVLGDPQEIQQGAGRPAIRMLSWREMR